MFKLVQLYICFFAIVKASDEDAKMPITAHGFIQVSDRVSEAIALLSHGKMSSKLEDLISKKYIAFLLHEKMSSELESSNELESLKEQAIDLTEEAVDDEFGD